LHSDICCIHGIESLKKLKFCEDFLIKPLILNARNFNVLNKYEYTQEDYLKLIDVNTFSLVRGENLYNFLVSFYVVFQNHIHNVNEPYAKLGFDSHEKMEQLFKTLKNDILNPSIRIN
jgi:hypothetical protein